MCERIANMEEQLPKRLLNEDRNAVEVVVIIQFFQWMINVG